VALATSKFDLDALRLSTGEGRRLQLHVAIPPYVLGAEPYPVESTPIPVSVEVSRTNADGYALRLRFQATLRGPCMRCLQTATPTFDVEAREVSQPGGEEELQSPYVVGGVLDVDGWARDALALMLPTKLLCREDCAGLCPQCGIDLNMAEEGHAHSSEPDPRWAKLSEIRFQ
jgi:uncharacterized protein